MENENHMAVDYMIYVRVGGVEIL